VALATSVSVGPINVRHLLIASTALSSIPTAEELYQYNPTIGHITYDSIVTIERSIRGDRYLTINEDNAGQNGRSTCSA
jgi:hypothetical protein